MEKRDCLVAVFDFCNGRSYPRDSLKEVLRQARIRARKLVVVSRCGGVADVFPIVRALAADNVDFPVRHYHQLDAEKAAQIEDCRTFEVINL